jgi:nitrous oxidase accessory protein NosD
MRVTPEHSREDIQAAIDELAAEGGGTLRLAAGTYEMDAALVWRAGVDIRGEGYATRLLATDATNVVESPYDEDAAEGELHDATISNLRLDGNRHEVPDGADPGDDYPDTHATSGLWIPFAERVTVRNLVVEHCHGHGIHPDAVVDATITNNVVHDCLIGFHIATRKGYQYGPVRTVAAGNHVLDCRLNGIDFGSQARDCVAAHNTVENCAHGGHGEEEWAGLRLRGRDNVALGNGVTNCRRGVLLARDRTTEGWVRGRRLSALGNRARGCTGPGVVVREVEGADVAHNAVTDCETGVRVVESPRTTIANNTVRNCAADGVHVDVDSTDCLVAENDVVDCASATDRPNERPRAALRLEADDCRAVENAIRGGARGLLLAPATGDGETRHRLVARGNHLSGCAGVAIRAERVDDATVSENLADDCGAGIQVRDAGDASVRGNRLLRCDVGITCQDSAGVAADDNAVRDAGDAVRIEGCSEAALRNNSIADATRGIVALNLRGGLVTGNAVRDAGEGMAFEGAVDDVAVSGNRV